MQILIQGHISDKYFCNFCGAGILQFVCQDFPFGFGQSEKQSPQWWDFQTLSWWSYILNIKILNIV